MENTDTHRDTHSFSVPPLPIPKGGDNQVGTCRERPKTLKRNEDKKAGLGILLKMKVLGGPSQSKEKDEGQRVGTSSVRNPEVQQSSR